MENRGLFWAASLVVIVVVGVLSFVIAGEIKAGTTAFDVLKQLQTLIAATIALAGVTIAYLGATRKVASDENARRDDLIRSGTAIVGRAELRVRAITNIANMLQANPSLAALRQHLDHGLREELDIHLAAGAEEIKDLWAAAKDTPLQGMAYTLQCIGQLELCLGNGKRMLKRWMNLNLADDDPALPNRVLQFDIACFSLLDLRRRGPFRDNFSNDAAARPENWQHYVDNIRVREGG
jgi:phage tail protein X